MTAVDLDRWLSGVLKPEMFAEADPSRNGLQVDNDGRDISCVAFAVDACRDSFERAAAAGAGMLVVHHGLFWKEAECVTGPLYQRIKTLFDNNIALYASHLPLDAHPLVGHNAGLAARIGLERLEPFGIWRGLPIGFKGFFSEPVHLDVVLSRLFPDGKKPLAVLPFGQQNVCSVGIVSGGASDELWQAIDEKLDLFITGEISHEIYHPSQEHGISVIAGGHYQTETVGLKLLSEKLALETGLETVFIDVPTGL